MSGIYIHIPFCKQACHYCDFHFSTSTKKKDQMVFALCNEIKLRRPEIDDHEVIETIYFGGGTPSILSVSALKFIIDTIYENYLVSDEVEITIEANPDDLTEAYIKSLAPTEVNRLSIGIQSFFEEDLKLMNRAHNAKEALDCLFLATSQFDNISIDLIYGIPGMSSERWQENLKIALDTGIPHISSYALTVEPNTALSSFIEKGIISPIEDELAQEHFDILVETMEHAGFEYYEFSNFGKQGYFSKNNTAYWQGKHYLGIGPSAHSYNGKERSWNINNNIKYIKALQENKLPREIETLTTTDKYNEYVMTGLRTIWGVSLQKIENDFGVSYKEYLLKQGQKHLDEHLLFLDGDILIVTKKGKFLSDGIASDLFLLNLG
ncbi:radical SAM family heme chaperone HemW [Aquimarina sp. BL5]|uniref:radical SAM family heme chaperone HemW n=1 Tax=Aquimarina sp. BL5 TaxID=1714860 RepID=UPI000E48DCC5|nr:radical SAM family heme chaperone HemW [Aquimarina sp. BL5]AXT54101.1 radical SAM family heme chaperone HemW [Aquimarina sp. BL5]RKN10326.1 radical SAM family heme chaperone HemW [Aquimarina sp. BL5]